jgi:EmrB/QacA subfamily drug resistance transporter
MTLLDTSIVHVALPSIIRDFDSTVAQGQLVVTIYLVALAIVIPISGFLGERIGLKRMFMLTMLGFTVASAMCSFAWDMQSLIVFRALQGLGGGMIQPIGTALVFSMITPLERGRFMVLLGLPILLGPLLGPSVGGVLVDYIDWRAVFLINVPIGIVNIVMAQAMLKETPLKKDTRFDALGFSLAAIAFPCILLGLSEGSKSRWDEDMTLVLLTVGVCALVTFVIAELRNPDPMLDLRIFKRPMFAIAIFMTAVAQFCFFGSQFLLPLFLQEARGLSASHIGLILLPTAIVDFAAVNVSGRLYNRYGPKPFAIFGTWVMCATSLALSFVNAGTNEFVIAGVASLRGLGMGMAMMPVSTMAFNAVTSAELPRASAMQNALQRVFGSASAAILTTILALSVHRNAGSAATVTSPDIPTEVIVLAFNDAFMVMSIVAAVGLVVAFWARDDVLREHQERERAGEPIPVEV